MNRIQTGDLVIVTTGKSKGHIGNVKNVKGTRVVVEGANIITKCVKPNPQINEPGGLIKREASIHVSNVALYNQMTKKADKVGFKFIEQNGTKQKVRYFKSNNEMVAPV
jgi:large subunit ribosomal protein L24